MKNIFYTPKLWVLVVSAVVLRLLFLFYLFPHYFVDFATVGNQYFFDHYREIAQQILLGNGYRLYPAAAPALHRPPGYVLLMLLNFPLSENCALFMHIQNAILGGFSCLLTYALAVKLKVNEKRAFGAAAVVAFWPFLIWESKVTVPENLLIVLVPLFFILFSSYYEERNPFWRAILCGVIWGWIVLTHGIYQASLPAIGLAFCLSKPKRAWHRRWVVFFFIGSMGVLSPWLIRNYLVAGYPVGVATGFGYHYFKGNHNYEVLVSGGNYWRDLEQDAHRFMIDKIKQAGFEYRGDSLFRTDHAINRDLDREAVRDVFSHPGYFIKRGLLRFFPTWIYQQNEIRTIFNGVLVFPLFVFAVMGAIRLRKERLAMAAVLFFLTINFFTAAIHPEAIPMRYALPLLPLLSILASAGLGKPIPRVQGLSKIP